MAVLWWCLWVIWIRFITTRERGVGKKKVCAQTAHMRSDNVMKGDFDGDLEP